LRELNDTRLRRRFDPRAGNWSQRSGVMPHFRWAKNAESCDGSLSTGDLGFEPSLHAFRSHETAMRWHCNRGCFHSFCPKPSFKRIVAELS
jgi:hypothetical protein